MVLKGFSYAMIGAFAGGLVFTLVGASQALLASQHAGCRGEGRHHLLRETSGGAKAPPLSRAGPAPHASSAASSASTPRI